MGLIWRVLFGFYFTRNTHPRREEPAEGRAIINEKKRPQKTHTHTQHTQATICVLFPTPTPPRSISMCT